MADEDEVYRLLGYSPIPPELREDTGELELARQDALPELVELGDMRGDLHSHTTASRRQASLAEMVGRGDGARATSTWRSPTTRRRRHGHRPRGRRRAWRTPSGSAS